MKTSDKPCSKCKTGKCEIGYRFCSSCRNQIEREMSSSNYLTPYPRHSAYRGASARENVKDTKEGHR